MGTQLLVVVAVGALAAQAPTQASVAERITRGEQLVEALEYEEAAEELMLALGDPRATDDELLQANLLAGVANRVLDRNVEARLNFHYVLTRAPRTELPAGTAPKIGTFFELVRREVEAEKVDDDAPAIAPDEAPTGATEPAAPAMAARPDEAGGVGPFFWTGAVVLGATAGLAALFVAGAAAGEIVLNLPAVPGDTKGIFGIVGQMSLLLLLLTPIGLLGGGALLGWGLIE